MSLIHLPEIVAKRLETSPDLSIRPDALERWNPSIRASVESSEPSISIYEIIGRDYEGRGASAQKIAGILRAIGEKDVFVNINSPGGDVFEGFAIYNILRMHRAKVTVRVMGLAASAASLIAMAGDDIYMGDGAQMMIHNAWAVAVGNRHDMRSAADVLEPIDLSMAELYAARTSQEQKTILKMMDAETWLTAEQSIEKGFATEKLDRSSFYEASAEPKTKALATLEYAMAKAGYSRSQRREAFNELFSKPGAADAVKPSADEYVNALQNLISTFKG
jgi:ATP-dependent protease ClpP protease subunit